MSRERYYKQMDGEALTGWFATPLAHVVKSMTEIAEATGQTVVEIEKEEYDLYESEEWAGNGV